MASKFPAFKWAHSKPIWANRKRIYGRTFIWRACGWLALSLLFGYSIYINSIVIDGSRYYWLDDDQMISMRYARNFASGEGLVWNPGEYVEGYSNFLWTLFMTGVHLLPIHESKTAIVIKATNFILFIGLIEISIRLTRRLFPSTALSIVLLAFSLILCRDILLWSTNGFETTLLTVIFMLTLLRLFEEAESNQPRASTYLLLGALPVVRSDGYVLWAAAVTVAAWVSQERKKTLGLIILSLLFPVAHLLFRYFYYQAWLPNTYYMKVANVPGRMREGVSYLARFVDAYAVVIAFAIGGIVSRKGRKHWPLGAVILLGSSYVVFVGGDMFPGNRFFAPYIPLLFILAMGAVQYLANPFGHAKAILLFALFALITWQTGIHSIRASETLRTVNGDPESGVVAGVLINRHSAADAVIAAFAIGNLGYFSHRYVLDMLGKTDPHIAKLTAANHRIGINKFDTDYVLSREPDVIAPLSSHRNTVNADEYLDFLGIAAAQDYYYSLVTDSRFKALYAPNPVSLPYLLERNSVYLRTTQEGSAYWNDYSPPNLSK